MSRADCPPEFTAPLRITVALQAAYTEADNVYAPDRGLGDRVHDIAVYDVLCMLLERDLLGLPGVSFESRGQGPQLRVGDLRVRWNKVGRGEAGQTIDTSFPRGSRAAVFMALENQQMTLWSEPSEDDAHPSNWIICHLGNPRDGLRAIYLAAPIQADGERVTAWRSSVAIWSADDPGAEFPAAPPIGLPEAALLPDLEISLLDDSAGADAAG